MLALLPAVATVSASSCSDRSGQELAGIGLVIAGILIHQDKQQQAS